MTTVAVSTSFITLTVSGEPPRWYKPGDTDPAVPLVIYDHYMGQLMSHSPPPELATVYNQRASAWVTQSIAMVRGGERPWWQWDVAASQDMAYECDARLGSPSEADCTHIEWEQLLPASDTLEVGPGLVTFLHSSKRLSCLVPSIPLTLAAQRHATLPSRPPLTLSSPGLKSGLPCLHF